MVFFLVDGVMWEEIVVNFEYSEFTVFRNEGEGKFVGVGVGFEGKGVFCFLG